MSETLVLSNKTTAAINTNVTIESTRTDPVALEYFVVAGFLIISKYIP
jgi:hypothetical protein